MKVIDFLRQSDFIDIDNLNNSSHLIIVLEYISQTRDISLEELSDIIQKTGIEGDKIMPTLAQRLEKQGLKKGLQQGVQRGILIDKQNVLIRQMQKKFGLGKTDAELIKKTHSTSKLEKALDLMVMTDVKDEVLRELR